MESGDILERGGYETVVLSIQWRWLAVEWRGEHLVGGVSGRQRLDEIRDLLNGILALKLKARVHQARFVAQFLPAVFDNRTRLDARHGERFHFIARSAG